jgi:hypothetical protein
MSSRDRPRWSRRTAATLVALLVCGVYALANLVLVTRDWEFDDIHSYLNAAQRIRDGAPLYVTAADPSDLYLYSPWFAFAWVPFTFLPRISVEVGWAAVLLLSTVAAVMPLRRSIAGIALALLLGGLLYRTAGWGNVQPLIVAVLVYALPTRAGPWAIGLSASLKPLTLLLLAAYAWRREWQAVAIGLGLAIVLWLPLLLFDPATYPLGSRVPNLYDATLLLAVPGLIHGLRRTIQPSPALAGLRSRVRAS